ncbi:MAG: hypothetical protein AAF808_14260 [Cyanobacteria bacterium P01_D01_bin.2]
MSFGACLSVWVKRDVDRLDVGGSLATPSVVRLGLFDSEHMPYHVH